MLSLILSEHWAEFLCLQLGSKCRELKDIHFGQCYKISDEGMVVIAKSCLKLQRIYMQENKLVSTRLQPRLQPASSPASSLVSIPPPARPPSPSGQSGPALWVPFIPFTSHLLVIHWQTLPTVTQKSPNRLIVWSYGNKCLCVQGSHTFMNVHCYVFKEFWQRV